MNTPHFEYLLRLADNSLILGQRLAEWCGHGPALEEDIALTNVALDLIGQARLLLAHAGRIEGNGRDEDALAFLRGAPEFRNLTMLELPNGFPLDGGKEERDFAVAIVRNVLFSTFQSMQWQMLASSSDDELSAIAMKSLKEARYHEEHAAEWLVRLGDGTDESHRRVDAALKALWPYAAEFFVADDVDRAMAATGFGIDPSALEASWRESVSAILERAMLDVPGPSSVPTTGKFGVHSEHLDVLLAEMQSLQRAYPGGAW